MKFIDNLIHSQNTLDRNWAGDLAFAEHGLPAELTAFKKENFKLLQNRLNDQTYLAHVLKEDYAYLKELPANFYFIPPNLSTSTLSPAQWQHCQTLSQSYTQPNQTVLVFINGILNLELSQLQKEVVDLKTLASPPQFSKIQQKNLFYLLNDCFFSEYHHLEIKDHTTLAQPLLILHLYSEQETEDKPFYQTKLFLEIGENSQIALQEIYQSVNSDLEQNSYYACNIHSTILLKRSATLKHYLLQNHALNSYHFVNSELKLEKSAEYYSFLAQLGSKLSAHHQHVQLKETASKADLSGIYLVQKEQSLQNLIHIEHCVSGCSSNQLFKGILKNESQATFTGKVTVYPNAINTLSAQINRNLLLGEKAYLSSKPQLEINNDDVKCSHGSTTGRLNPLEIFYLCSRGIPKAKALNLLAFAFINECLLKITDADLKEKIIIEVNRFFAEID